MNQRNKPAKGAWIVKDGELEVPTNSDEVKRQEHLFHVLQISMTTEEHSNNTGKPLHVFSHFSWKLFTIQGWVAILGLGKSWPSFDGEKATSDFARRLSSPLEYRAWIPNFPKNRTINDMRNLQTRKVLFSRDSTNLGKNLLESAPIEPGASTEIMKIQYSLSDVRNRVVQMEGMIKNIEKTLESVVHSSQAQLTPKPNIKESDVPKEVYQEYKIVQFNSFDDATDIFIACLDNPDIGEENVEMGLGNRVAVKKEKLIAFNSMLVKQGLEIRHNE